MSLVRPIHSLGTRLPEHGRIRMGKTTTSRQGKKIPTSLDTFRFTSPDRVAIEQLAELYGGTPKQWRNDKANPQDQWEVESDANDIRVLLPEGALSIWYELWGGGGIVRRCDGVTVEVPTRDRASVTKTDCLCAGQSEMTCKPHTRLAVLQPDIRFGGVWRLETQSWNAADEMPAMEAILHELQDHGILEARLVLAKQSVEGGSKQFVVPKLVLGVSAQAAIEGAAGVAALGSRSTPVLQLGAGDGEPEDVPSATEQEAEQGGDDDIVDAEIVDDDEAAQNESRIGSGTDVGSQAAAAEEPVTPASKRTALVMACKRIADMDEVKRLDPPPTDEQLRHSICARITNGRTRSSTKLSSQEASTALDLANEVLERRRVVSQPEPGKFLMKAKGE